MFKKLFAQVRGIFSHKQGSILSAATVIMVSAGAAGVLGFVKDRLLTSYFSTNELGVYFAAFRLPNLLFELLIMGILSTAFVPVFTHLMVKTGKEDAFKMAANVINVGVIVVVLLAIPLFLFTKQISYFLVPGFSPSERLKMIAFTRIMLAGQVVPLIIGNFVTGMLQSFQRFLVPALAPLFYNIGTISGIIFLTPVVGLYGPVWGAVLGGCLYLLIQLPLLFSLGYRHKFRINSQDAEMRQVGRLMLPRIFGLVVSQVDTTTDLILTSLLGTSFITIFNFAQNLQQLPITLFGSTFAQAALPVLATEGAKKDLVSFKKLFLATMHQTLFFVFPASVMLMVLRIPIVRLVYGSHRFNWSDTVSTGQTVSIFAISIFAQSIVQLFARGFYALYDTKTPVIVSVISILTNTILSVFFIVVLHLPIWSLALSTTVANLVNITLLFIFFYRKVAGFDLKMLLLPPFKMVVASVITGIFLYVPLKLLDQLVFDTTRVVDLVLLTGVATFSGLSVYVFLAWFFNIEEVGTFFKLISKVKRVQNLFFTPSQDIVDEEDSGIS